MVRDAALEVAKNSSNSSILVPSSQQVNWQALGFYMHQLLLRTTMLSNKVEVSWHQELPNLVRILRIRHDL